LGVWGGFCFFFVFGFVVRRVLLWLGGFVVGGLVSSRVVLFVCLLVWGRCFFVDGGVGLALGLVLRVVSCEGVVFVGAVVAFGVTFY